MCNQCQDLEIYESIREKLNLDTIISLLKTEKLSSVLKATCLLTNQEITNFEDFDLYQRKSDMISIKFTCIICNSEFNLFVETSPQCIGFFSPHSELTV